MKQKKSRLTVITSYRRQGSSLKLLVGALSEALEFANKDIDVNELKESGLPHRLEVSNLRES